MGSILKYLKSMEPATKEDWIGLKHFMKWAYNDLDNLIVTDAGIRVTRKTNSGNPGDVVETLGGRSWTQSQIADNYIRPAFVFLFSCMEIWGG